METEKEILYSILNTIRNAEHNSDENISERLMLSFIRTYRIDALRKYYKDGHIINDEVYQLVPLELIEINKTNEFKTDIPKTIKLSNNYGFYIEKNEISIPIVNSESYSLSKKNQFAKKIVQSKTQQNTLTLFGGIYDNTFNGQESNALLFKFIYDEKELQVNADVQNVKIKVDFFGVLVNPEMQPGYDWEADVFPFPAEKIEELKSQILRKEFGIMVQAKSDEISNSRNDSVNPKQMQEGNE